MLLSQLEMLKDKLPALEAEFGPANPYVQGLKMQIASLEKPRADNPTADLDRLSVGMRAAPSDEGQPIVPVVKPSATSK